MSRKREPEAVICDDSVLVKHTHDVELAEKLARQAYDDGGYYEPEVVAEMRFAKVRPIWARIAPCLPNTYGAGEGWAWQYLTAKEGSRGAFRAVEILL